MRTDIDDAKYNDDTDSEELSSEDSASGLSDADLLVFEEFGQFPM